MIWLKGCPRCRGDLFGQRRDTETALSCLQCGHEVLRADAAALWRRNWQQQRLAASA
jgi:hypothetical protein